MKRKHIFSLESKNKTIEKETKLLREKQKDFIQNSSTSNKDDEPDMYGNCKNLKNEIYDLPKTFFKFTEGSDNFQVLLGNQRAS